METLLPYGAALFVLRKAFKAILVLSFLVLPAPSGQAADKFIVLCYHDIPEVASTPEDVPRHIFVKHLEYLWTNGFEFISPQDIRQAHEGRKILPEKAVLLSFDDAYLSFYQFVFPILQLYKASAVLSVPTSWIDQKPEYVDKPLMSWSQIREVQKSGLVFIASHAHDLHREVVYNSAGNVGPASSLFIYNPENKQYENESSFQKRIASDLSASQKKMEIETGERPWILTWPFGKFNLLGMEEAQKLGFTMILTLESGLADARRLERTNRNMVFNEMGISYFISSLQKGFADNTRIRAAQIDLDMIVNPLSYEESDHNLGLLIERLLALGVNTVFLQGFGDIEGTGNIRSVYFPNTILPVRMDFLSHAVHQIKIRNIKTYVWMPVLSFELEDKALNESLKVREMKNGKKGITTSWYRRLTPFDKKTLEMAKSLYRDLSAHVDFDGILFQDDLYLTDEEDFHPSALRAFQEHFGMDFSEQRLTEKPFKEKWIALKTGALNKSTQEIMEVVRRYRPKAEFARNIYSEVVLNPKAREWFSQNLEDFLKIYDYSVIMAYPQMENIHNFRQIKNWFNRLVDVVNQHKADKQVIFKIQSYDWKEKKWIKTNFFHEELRYLLSLGVRHIGYYPDNVFMNEPKAGKTPAISARQLP